MVNRVNFNEGLSGKSLSQKVEGKGVLKKMNSIKQPSGAFGNVPMYEMVYQMATESIFAIYRAPLPPWGEIFTISRYCVAKLIPPKWERERPNGWQE